MNQYSFGELEWISINLSKSAVFSLQTLKVLGKSVGGENAKVPRYEVKW